jgi:TPR repeat protein/predicted Ser/Thr protein kinase
MSNSQHCINCLRESKGLYEYPCASCNWSPEQYSKSGLYLSPGTILHGQYQIGKLLGHGGFGITYLAWDNLLEIKLAIKEYMPRDFATRNTTNSEISAFAGDAKANFTYGLERFLEEARTLAKFQQHNGIVSVLNVFYGNGTGYMVMEYVDGFTLKEYLIQKEKLSWAQTLKVFMPVMDALREVHKYGMLHRDISPDNIYLCRDNRVKLLDFGSARYSLGGHSRSLSVVVKPGYAPEEQYRTKGNQGPWTDVYSVAASMYRCITGLVPPDALDRLDEDELTAPSMLGVNIPEKAEHELMVALAIKSNQRTQSIDILQKGVLGTGLSDNPSLKRVQKSNIKANLPGDFSISHIDDKKNGGNKTWYALGMFLLIIGYIYFPEVATNYQLTPVSKKTAFINPTEEKIIPVIQPQLESKPKPEIKLKPPEMTVAEKIILAKQYYDSRDYTKAFEIFIGLATTGSAIAQNYIGWMYANAQGIEKNDQEAIKWYLQSANQGLKDAQYNLGFMYENGKGVAQNDKEALRWYQLSASQGNKNSEIALNRVKESIGQKEKDKIEALEPLEQIKIAGKYYQEKKYKQASLMYQLAADKGNSVAQYNLAVMYEKGLGVTQDYKKSFYWYEKASNQGDASAQSKLGTLYAKGQGVNKDYSIAIQLYQLAAAQGLAQAQNNLGVMYLNGYGVDKDKYLAIKWFDLAVKQGDKEAIKVLKDLQQEDLKQEDLKIPPSQTSANKTEEFIDNKDGTVTHTKTGLIWQRCAVGQTWTETTCNGTAKVYTWEDAKQFNNFSTKYNFRLPTKAELMSLVLCSNNEYLTDGSCSKGAISPTINTKYFPYTPVARFWTSSPGPTGHPWIVNFSDGFSYYHDKYNFILVRLVRG